MRIFVKFLALAMAGQSSVVAACAIYSPPAYHLKRGYGEKIIKAAVVGRVMTAEYIRKPIADAHPWRAVVKADRGLFGPLPTGSLSVEQGWGSAACDHGFKKPRAGDLWVLYFWRNSAQQLQVWAAYPLAVARASDPKLRQRFPQ